MKINLKFPTHIFLMEFIQSYMVCSKLMMQKKYFQCLEEGTL